MPAPLRTTLTPAETTTLEELRRVNSVCYRVRDRAHMLLLNAAGWRVATIAELFKCHEHTVRAAIKRWETDGLYGLWEQGGRGKKRRWHPSDMAYLESCLAEEERTYNSTQLAAKLAAERGVRLSADRIRRLLKKRAIAGSERGTAIESDKIPE